MYAIPKTKATAPSNSKVRVKFGGKKFAISVDKEIMPRRYKNAGRTVSKLYAKRHARNIFRGFFIR